MHDATTRHIDILASFERPETQGVGCGKLSRRGDPILLQLTLRRRGWRHRDGRHLAGRYGWCRRDGIKVDVARCAGRLVGISRICRDGRAEIDTRQGIGWWGVSVRG